MPYQHKFIAPKKIGHKYEAALHSVDTYYRCRYRWQ